MNAYFEFILVFLLIFALGYTLIYLPGIIKIKDIFKRNLVFCSSALLTCFLLDAQPKVSYLWALCFIYFMFNVYSLFTQQRQRSFKIRYALIDFILCSLTLLASAAIIAFTDGLPITKVIHERFEDGSYTFTPGYSDEMITNSIVYTLIIINYKYIYYYLLARWERKQNRKLEHLQIQNKNIETQFDALQAKVNPHFLYNSLNSIAGLATVDGEKTRQMAIALSRFFRYSMNKEQEILITLKDEAGMIQTYLEIEKIRFGNSLNYIIELPQEIESRKIPRMILQPIVENSIKHGMKGEITTLTIHVSFSIINDILTLSVKDNGMPFPTDFLPGYGIQSVYKKLDLLYPNQYEVELNTGSEKDFKIMINGISN